MGVCFNVIGRGNAVWRALRLWAVVPAAAVCAAMATDMSACRNECKAQYLLYLPNFGHAIMWVWQGGAGG